MPHHSRSRDRRRDRDGERERQRQHTTRRNFYDDDDDDDFDHSLDERRYRRDRDGYDRSRGQSRGYESHGYYERDDGMNDDYDDDLPADRHGVRRPATEERWRERSKAKESPATSPVKKRERARDREGHRRHNRAYGEDGSPTKEFRERRHRHGDGRRERYRETDDEARRERRRRERERSAAKHQSHDSTNSASYLLGEDDLADLGAQRGKEEYTERRRAPDEARTDRVRRKKQAMLDEKAPALGLYPEAAPRRDHRGRVVSGSCLEEGRGPDMKMRRRGGGGAGMESRWRKEDSWDGGSNDDGSGQPFWKKKKWIWIGIVVVILLLVIIIPVAVVLSRKHKDPEPETTSESDSRNSNLNGLSHDSIPESARGTILDPWTWYDTTDFNVTYTDATVGGLSIMGLNSTWDDSARPNEHVPPLNEPFPYGSQPIRGVNLGGWLSIEPFIAPSLFERYPSHQGIVDEYTLTRQLGNDASSTLEKHYATFLTEQDFAEIKDAGLDHVRIQYSYWAIETYDDDPYVAKISWRYLLRAIEYCRKYGLRVKLDLHGVVGSQNGWNHSGRQGTINWLNGTDGELNRQRSLDLHDKVSQFFAQDRYKNIITIYGLANEPLMLSLDVESVLNWTTEATELVQKNGISAYVAFHDGFLNLSKWKSMLKTGPSRMMLDTHQYTIFNTGQIVLDHTAKIKLICSSWYSMIGEINSTSTGWGPTICGEWSQADTDCAKYLNNVGRGTRWEGTFSESDNSQPQHCPTADSGTCSCAKANVDPSNYSPEYKKWLQTYAEAQMSAFETAQGWFYWTWHTESAAQWSYKAAWKNGFMPQKAYAPSFKCGDAIPDFGNLPEYY